MSLAKCRSCGRLVNWLARKGTRLKDVRCPKCNTSVRALRNEDYLAIVKEKLAAWNRLSTPAARG